jgi:hypothetical protein
MDQAGNHPQKVHEYRRISFVIRLQLPAAMFSQLSANRCLPEAWKAAHG